MSWTIRLTNQAIEDITAMHNYISKELFMPDTADNQIYRILNQINGLETMP